MKVFREKELSLAAGLFFSVIMWVVTCVSTLVCSLLDMLVVFPVTSVTDPRTRRLVHGVSILWARSIIAGNPIWKLAVSGLANVRKDRNYVVVTNHQSLLDILVVCAALPVNFKFLAKKELFYIPFLGWAMACAGYVPVDRSSHSSGRSAMKRISELLASGVSVLLFPEGTRSPDGKIHAFKSGAFKLARDSKAEILPVVVDGTGRALPKKSWIIRKRSTFVVSVGKPVSFHDMSDRSLEEAKEKVRHEMTGRLARLRHGREL